MQNTRAKHKVRRALKGDIYSRTNSTIEEEDNAVVHLDCDRPNDSRSTNPAVSKSVVHGKLCQLSTPSEARCVFLLQFVFCTTGCVLLLCFELLVVSPLRLVFCCCVFHFRATVERLLSMVCVKCSSNTVLLAAQKLALYIHYIAKSIQSPI